MPIDFSRYGGGDNPQLIVDTPDQLPEGSDPRIRKLFEYWQSIRPNDLLPGRQHFDPIDIPRLLPNLMLVDVEQPGPRLRNRLLGTRVVEYRGRDFTGRWFHEVFENFEQSDLFAMYRRVIHERRPVWHFGRPILHENVDYKSRELLCLPLARDGESVDMLLVMLIRPD